MVMVRDECPNNSCTLLMSTPFKTRWEAKVCLRSWNLKSSILAAVTVFLNYRLKS